MVAFPLLGKKKYSYKRDYCLIGFSEFNSEIARILLREKQGITILDSNEEVINAIGSNFSNAIKCNAMELKDLEDAGIQDFDYVIVGIGDVEESISICSNLKELGVKRIFAKAKNELHMRILRLIGVSNSIISEIYGLENLAYQTMFDIEVERLAFSKDDFEDQNEFETQEEQDRNELFGIRLPVYNPRL
ncbi:hypothetical protein PVNG_02438 [Plasmodium vivax North Korean]|uniref:RCK N-terminal domain-containing protein n=1 Tax=Plasmodium vivax North Korean TaxID=1035514 RepID=A0A0J9TKN5_PLAVI|nr:hypothetical protein PVNG_02438 [Plasmodium vivax North Korean]